MNGLQKERLDGHGSVPSFARLEPEERRIIVGLGLLPAGPVPCGKLERLLAPHAGRAEVRTALNRLQEKGAVRLLRNAAGDVYAGLVPERLTALHEAVFGLPAPAAMPVHATGPETEADLAMDAVTLLGLIADEQPALTKKGGLPKRTGDAWAKRMTLSAEAGRRLIGTKRAMLAVPDQVAVALDVLLRAGAAAFRDGRLLPEPEGAVRWLGKGDAAMRRDAWFLWLMAFPPAHPLARHAAWLLPRVPEGAWWTCAATEQAWRNAMAGLGLAAEAAESLRAERAWIADLVPLQEAGWLVFGETEEGEPAFRPARPLSGETDDAWPGLFDERSLYVQPDFELLLPSSGSYGVHGLLSGFAEPVVPGRMRVYRLTERSARRAFRRGWTAADMRAVMSLAAAGEVPDEPIRGLADWEKAMHRVRAEAAVIVRFADAETAAQFAAAEAFEPFFRADNRLPSGGYALNPAEWSAFREEAEKRGGELAEPVPPASGGQSGAGQRRDGGRRGDDGRQTSGKGSPHAAEAAEAAGAASAAGTTNAAGASSGSESNAAGTDVRLSVLAACLRRAGSEPGNEPGREAPRPGLFLSPFNLDGYRPAAKWRREELFPGLDEWPAVWWKGRFSGHPATKRRLLQLAMEWGCRVEAGLAGERPSGAGARDNRTVSFLVSALTEEADGWTISGRAADGPVHLKLEELADLRLLLPGISKINT